MCLGLCAATDSLVTEGSDSAFLWGTLKGPHKLIYTPHFLCTQSKYLANISYYDFFFLY